jgi:hypothetical protein
MNRRFGDVEHLVQVSLAQIAEKGHPTQQLHFLLLGGQRFSSMDGATMISGPGQARRYL